MAVCMVDRSCTARSYPWHQPSKQWILKYFIQSSLKFWNWEQATPTPSVSTVLFLEREAAGVQFPCADNRAEPVCSSLLSKWSYPSDWFLGKTSITAASLLFIICFLELTENSWKQACHLEFYEVYPRGKLKERRGKGSYFILNEIKWICSYDHSPNNHSLNSTAKLLAMPLSNAFYLSNIFSKAWFLKGISVSKTHSTRSQKSCK